MYPGVDFGALVSGAWQTGLARHCFAHIPANPTTHHITAQLFALQAPGEFIRQRQQRTFDHQYIAGVAHEGGFVRQ
jgi:hypothetical protein